jgi:formylglycine-generating enzyme required for sulfatase activity
MNATAEFDVFVSYNTLDHAAVERIARALQDRGLSVFLDRWELVPGRSWPQALEGQLLRCRCVAVVLGPSGLGPWQQRERTLALYRQDRDKTFGVIPVILPDADPALSFLSDNTWVDLRRGIDDAEILDLLAAAIRGEPPSALLERTRQAAAQVCPYRGLEVFREEDAPFFFGREAFAKDLCAAVADQSLVAVVGRSGSGKSSVVRAGLIPALRRPDGDRVWEIVTLLPGSQPLHALAGALLPLLEPEMTETDRLVEINKQAGHLTAGNLHLHQVIERVLAKQPGTDRLLLVVDQWEELYTQSRGDPAGRQVMRFIDELLAATQAAPVTLVLTLRADFYGDALLHRGLADRLRNAVVNLGPMTRQELQQAIVEPAEKVGLTFDTGLVDRLLDDVGDEPGNLPLMEFALKALWEARRGDRLLFDVYTSIGGVKGAIASRAETLYEKLDATQQRAAERVFTKLVRPGEETGDTRRRADLSELDPAEKALVRSLAGKDARLLVTGRDPLADRETVEVAHEALIREWGRLKGWVGRVRERLKDQVLMEDLAEQWQAQGRPRLGGLATGRQLQRFERAGATSELAAAYLQASRARRTLGHVSVGLGVITLVVFVAGLTGQVWLDSHHLTLRHPMAAIRSAMGFWPPIEPDSGMALIAKEKGQSMRFKMGLDSAEEPWLGRVHEVEFARSFLIGKREVSFAEYDRFALATWRKLPDDQGWGRDDRPVINVTWDDAVAYVQWLRDETHKNYRLPTEAEWEYAARGGRDTAYWWGDEIRQDGKVWANCNGCGSEWDGQQTAPVDSLEENPFGLKNTAGNVWEWIQDCGHDNYDGAPPDGSAWEEKGCGRRVVRGGSWKIGPGYLRSANRSGNDTGNRHFTLGFRLAQDP